MLFAALALSAAPLNTEPFAYSAAAREGEHLTANRVPIELLWLPQNRL